MPREPDPINDPELFDSLELGGVRSPGVVKISGHDFVVEWDVKEASGQAGATTTLKGIKLGRFTATFFLADGEDIAAWPAFAEVIESTVLPRPHALEVYHPDLSVQGIDACVLESFGGAVHDGGGGQTITVKFIEYSPPKPKGGSPNGATKKGDPNKAALDELEALTKTYTNTPWNKP